MRLPRKYMLLLLLAFPSLAWADIAVQWTRVVHEGDAPRVPLRIWNQGKAPSLIQAWIDDGDKRRAPEELKLPFFAAPPLFRINPAESKDVTIHYIKGNALPKDRESLFWYNILDVPASDAARNTQSVDYSVRWRLKILHRPSGLAGDAEKAPASLQWSRSVEVSGQVKLRVGNPSPYYVTLAKLFLGADELPLEPEDGVIAPYSVWSYLLPAGSEKSGATLRFVWIDDKGREQPAEDIRLPH